MNKLFSKIKEVILNLFKKKQPVPTTIVPVLPSPVVVVVPTPPPVVVSRGLYGFASLHAGESYDTIAITPPFGQAPGSIINFPTSRLFVGQNDVEVSPGNFVWDAGNGHNTLSRAKVFQASGVKFVIATMPNWYPSFYPGLPWGGLNDPQLFSNFLIATLEKFVPLGCIALEPSNEPESGSWGGLLGHQPAGSSEIRQAARDLVPWFTLAGKTLADFNQAHGTDVELWGPACQSMATPDPLTGLAAMYCSTDIPYYNGMGAGFLDGKDANGDTVAKYLRRFSFHGYCGDPSTLGGLIDKAQHWLDTSGIKVPIVITEHGPDDPKAFRAMDSTSRLQWVNGSFDTCLARNVGLIYYAWDEADYGLFGTQGPIPEVSQIAQHINGLNL